LTALLDVEDLRVAYGTRLVLDGIGLRVDPGEVVGLLGRTGSGKTTLLRAISGVTPFFGGRVLVHGQAASTLKRRALSRRLAVVPQMPLLPVGFTALQVALMGRTPHLGFFAQEGPVDYRRALQALAVVGAETLSGRLVDQLSGGERQKVALARCLAQDASILLLDEPTAHLDIAHQISIARLVRELAREEGLAVLAAMHDLNLAALYCDRLVLLDGGKVLADGDPEDVITTDNIARVYQAQVNILRTPGVPGPIVAPYAVGIRTESETEAGEFRSAPGPKGASVGGAPSPLPAVRRRPAGMIVIGELGGAIRILTRVPMPAFRDWGTGAAAFGLVGAALGLIAALPVVALGSRLPLLAAVLAVGVLALASGGLHLDGLADTFDALAAVNPEAGERALKDPRIGPAGASALILVLALDIACIAGLARSPVAAAWALVVAASGSRALAAVAAPWVPRGERGFGAWFAGQTPRWAALTAAVIPLAIAVAAGINGLISLAAGSLVGVATLVLFARRFEAVSGDGFGAAVELSFAAAVVAAVITT
jgi:iron complex transport system ATP-binding protein